jgi:hypothetical protein
MMTFQREIHVQCRDEKGVLQTAVAKIEVNIDPAMLARDLGHKALRNRSKKSRLAIGITAEVIRDIPKGWKRTTY